MQILILNWRDIKNPRAGGAELLTHEVAKRWVAAGHTVTIFSERFEGAAGEEEIDGVTVVRRGRWWSVHLWAMIYYFFRFRLSTDFIIDEVHWYPFFSILYAPKKTVLLVCEVASQLFFRLFPYPIALFGRILEKLYIFFYRKAPVLAISRSTRDALVGEGFHPENITVIPMGLSLQPHPKSFAKASRLTLIVVGRLHALKGTKGAITAFARIQTRVPMAHLWIVGSDSDGYRSELVSFTQELGVTTKVRFFGRVSRPFPVASLKPRHLKA